MRRGGSRRPRPPSRDPAPRRPVRRLGALRGRQDDAVPRGPARGAGPRVLDLGHHARPAARGDDRGGLRLRDATASSARCSSAVSFAEWATVHGHLYGTRGRARWRRRWPAARDVLLDIDTQGAAQLRARYPEAVLVFIVAPSMAGAGAAAARAALRRRGRHRAAAGPRARGDRAVAPVRLSDREPRSQGGLEQLVADHSGRALSHGAPRPAIPRSGGQRLMGFPHWRTRSTRCPTATCSSCSPPSGPVRSTAARPRAWRRATETDKHGPGGDRGGQGRLPRERGG